MKKKKIAVIGSGSHRSALADALLNKCDLHGVMDSKIIGSTMQDYYELKNIITDIPLVYDDGKDYRNESKHRATCAKNRANRKSKKRKKR